MSFCSIKFSITYDWIEQQTYQFEQYSVFASSSSIFPSHESFVWKGDRSELVYIYMYLNYRVVMLSITFTQTSNVCFWKHYNESLPLFHFLISLNALSWKYCRLFSLLPLVSTTLSLLLHGGCRWQGEIFATALFTAKRHLRGRGGRGGGVVLLFLQSVVLVKVTRNYFSEIYFFLAPVFLLTYITKTYRKQFKQRKTN